MGTNRFTKVLLAIMKWWVRPRARVVILYGIANIIEVIFLPIVGHGL